jgi:Mn-containing catalase
MNEPTYLPLLNSIAVNEAKGQILLDAWASTTKDESLAQALRFVAIREGEHAMAFTKRMCELGHAVCEENAYQVFKDFDGLVACVKSSIPTAEDHPLQGRRGNEDAKIRSPASSTTRRSIRKPASSLAATSPKNAIADAA